jgi:hypothetical protein
LAAFVEVDAGLARVILAITRAARFGVLKILMKGMSSGTSSGAT